MEQSSSWETDSSSASQIPRIWWNQNIFDCLQEPATCPYPEPQKVIKFRTH